MQTISSKDVAGMLGKRHDNFVRDIRKYITLLGKDAPKYFIESSKASYEVTLKGCELIAGRMVGEKGTAFKEKYLRVVGVSKKEWEEPRIEPVIADLTIEEVAKRLGCSERNVYRNIKNGKLQAIQKEVFIPTIRIFVTEDALEMYLNERKM